MEQPFLLSRWKGYHDTLQIYDFIEKFTLKYPQQPCYLALPFHAIRDLNQKISSKKILIGAEHMNGVSEGAFTASVAASMLKKAGANFVMIGSSDQRRLFHETNTEVHDKLLHALQHNLKPILCVQAEADLEQELSEGIGNFNAEQIGQIYLLLETTGLENTFRSPSHKELIKIYQDFSKLAEKVLGEAFSSAKILYSVPVDIDRFTDLFMEQPAAGFYSPFPEFFLDLLKQDLQLQIIPLPEPIEEEVEEEEKASQVTLREMDEILEEKNEVLEKQEFEDEKHEMGATHESLLEEEKEVFQESSFEEKTKEISEEEVIPVLTENEESLVEPSAQDQVALTIAEKNLEEQESLETITEIEIEENKELIKEQSISQELPAKEGEVRTHTVGDITKKTKSAKSND